MNFYDIVRSLSLKRDIAENSRDVPHVGILVSTPKFIPGFSNAQFFSAMMRGQAMMNFHLHKII
jgi:hypothetical protein